MQTPLPQLFLRGVERLLGHAFRSRYAQFIPGRDASSTLRFFVARLDEFAGAVVVVAFDDFDEGEQTLEGTD